MTRPRRLPAALALAAALGGTARAQDGLFTQERVGFELNLGAGAILGPAAPGGAGTRARGLPYVNGGDGEWLDFDVLDGARLSLLRLGGLTAGPALRLREGREASDDRRRLSGLRGFSDTVEAGGFVAYETGPLYADLSLTQDVARSHRGAALEARVLLSVPLGPVAVSAGPRLRAADGRFARSFYGVSEAEAAGGRYPAYQPGGGVERWGALLAAQWRITDRWRVQGYAEYGRLQGDAAASPLVRAPGGSADQWSGGLFLSYRLD